MPNPLVVIGSHPGSFNHRAIDGADGAGCWGRSSACARCRWHWWREGQAMTKLNALLSFALIVAVAISVYLLGARSVTPEQPDKKSEKVVTTNLAGPRPLLPSRQGKSVAAQPGNEPSAKTVEVGGGGPLLDACGGVGRPTGLDPKGDNFLAVKAGPSLGAKRIDKLGPDAVFYICDKAANGQWLGVVYDGGGVLSERCGASSPTIAAKRYVGPCQFGWVSARYVELTAG